MRGTATILTLTLFLAGCSTETPDTDGAGTTTGGAVTPTDSATAPATGGSVAPAACPSDAGLDEVPDLHPSVNGYPDTRVALGSPDGSCRITLTVLHADNAERRAHGLMEVPALPAGTGMLFTYADRPGDRQAGYWMKNTLVPLSIAYIAADGTIVDIVAMDPCEADPCSSYPPSAPYRSALEVPQGWFDEVGAAEGWRVDVLAGAS